MIKRLLPVVVLFGSCAMPNRYAPGSFGADAKFLQAQDSEVVVLTHGDARVLVSPKFQGKVFTSTAAGDTGMSFGWIHYKAFDGPLDAHMNAYGGENRLWLGPEGGKFSLFFPKGAKMTFANWQTPAAFDSEPWTVVAHSRDSVELRKDMQLVNYAGTRLNLSIDRKIAIMDERSIDSVLGLSPDGSVAAVGYRTVNRLTNTGGEPWTDSTGMPCIWMLDMFNPSPSTVIVIPYSSAAGDTSKPATTDYFGEIPADRIKFVSEGGNGVIYFKADGKSRGKLGVHPARARDAIGSYDPVHHVLTVTKYDIDGTARYLNQEWNTVKPPFSGDAVNAYNDGPLADGSQMGPFYELESVSPAAFLSPGQALVHRYAVFHFTGPEPALDSICQKVLGVTIAQIEAAFQ
ncbi:MAG TPA: DUF6786 family protein [Puia sp.]|nr:DUF6786 family protein [Puia sp.]